MKLTRRALGGLAAAATVAQAPFNQVTNQLPRAGMPMSSMGETQAPQDDPEYAARIMRERRMQLFKDKELFERWARDEFTAEDLVDHGNMDPRRPTYDVTGHEINCLKSVSMGHKIRMAEELAHKRYRAYRVASAKEHLRKILMEIAGLG